MKQSKPAATERSILCSRIANLDKKNATEDMGL